jgi:hypothetical protein
MTNRGGRSRRRDAGAAQRTPLSLWAEPCLSFPSTYFPSPHLHTLLRAIDTQLCPAPSAPPPSGSCPCPSPRAESGACLGGGGAVVLTTLFACILFKACSVATLARVVLSRVPRGDLVAGAGGAVGVESSDNGGSCTARRLRLATDRSSADSLLGLSTGGAGGCRAWR